MRPQQASIATGPYYLTELLTTIRHDEGAYGVNCTRSLFKVDPIHENHPNPIQTCTQYRHLLMLSMNLYHKVLVHWRLSSLLPINLITLNDRGAAMNWDGMLLPVGYCCVTTSNTMSHLPIQGKGIHNCSNEVLAVQCQHLKWVS
jgi:hypothetical protein